MCSEENNDNSRKPPSLEDQVREMMGRMNLSFAGGQPSGESAEPEPDEDAQDREDRLKAIREFDLKPRDIRDYLDRFVIQQDDAKKVLSVAICDHYNHVRRCIEHP